MDTQSLKIIALGVGALDSFAPRSWIRLSDPRGPSVLVHGENEAYVIRAVTAERKADEDAGHVAGAVLRGVSPDPAVVHPGVVATVVVDAEAVEMTSEASVSLLVSLPLPGIPATTEAIAQPGIRDSIATYLARLHDADPGELADAGLPVRDSTEIRERLLGRLDRAAATGKVPATLLARWESGLENAGHWHFLAGPVHGDLGLDALRTDGRTLVALTDLARLHVGDPAEDLAALAADYSTEDFAAFLASYRAASGRADASLKARTELLKEFDVLDLFVTAHERGDTALEAEALELLSSLAEVTADQDRDHHRRPYADSDTEVVERPEAARPDRADVAATGVVPGPADAAASIPAAPSTESMTPRAASEAAHPRPVAEETGAVQDHGDADVPGTAEDVEPEGAAEAASAFAGWTFGPVAPHVPAATETAPVPEAGTRTSPSPADSPTPAGLLDVNPFKTDDTAARDHAFRPSAPLFDEDAASSHPTERISGEDPDRG